jgi:hypothetical protein
MQLHASPGGTLFAALLFPAVVNALGFRARIAWIACKQKYEDYVPKKPRLCKNYTMKHTFDRAPLKPLSPTVFLQFKQVQVLGSQRLPALKQSQYRATHFDLGQLHPVGFSIIRPSPSVAEHRRSSLSKPPSKGSAFLTRFVDSVDGEECQESLERLPMLSPSVVPAGDSTSLEGDTISLGMMMSSGMITLERGTGGVDEEWPPLLELVSGRCGGT